MEINSNTGLPFSRAEGTVPWCQHCCSRGKHIQLAELTKN